MKVNESRIKNQRRGEKMKTASGKKRKKGTLSKRKKKEKK